MIISQNFIWLHLPKTGGTSTAGLFRDLAIPGIQVDSDSEDSKHESIETRLNTAINTINTDNKISIITTRRLASWLLSDWHHKTKKIGLALPFEPVKSGLFYSLRLGGIWVSADYWIQYFQVFKCDRVIRLENLEEDSNKFVWPLLPPGTPKLNFPNRNINFYQKNIEFFFSGRDLERVHSNNPAWSEWEQKIYGNHSKIDPINRIRAKFSALKPSK